MKDAAPDADIKHVYLQKCQARCMESRRDQTDPEMC